MASLRLTHLRALEQLFQTRPGRRSFRLLQQTSQQTFRTRPSHFSTFQRISQTPRLSPSPFSRAARRTFQRAARRLESTTATANEELSLSQRLKKLSREYGWSAVGVYLALSALDFPFCFLAVRLLGTDRIGHWEHVVVTWVKDLVTWPIAGHSDAQEQVEDASQQVETVVEAPLEEVRDGQKRLLEEEETYLATDHGVKDAEKANEGSNASTNIQFPLYLIADNISSRSLDAACTCICHSQVLHLPPSTSDSCGNAKSGEDS